jgi:hypothetical protein
MAEKRRQRAELRIGSAEKVFRKRLCNELTEFLGSGEAAMFQGVRETVVGALGVDRETTLAAVLEDERTQTSAIVGAIGRHRNLQSKDELGFVRGLARRRKSARHNSNRVKLTAVIIRLLSTLFKTMA